MPRHVPQRSCIVCGLKTAKGELHRIVRRPDGGIEVDATGRRPGRGAYLCGAMRCWERALQGGRLASALSSPINEDVHNRLLAHIGRLSGVDLLNAAATRVDAKVGGGPSLAP